MSKLKEQDGAIVFVSNGLRAVSLDEDDHEEVLTVVLPEGVRLFVMPSDSGLLIADEAGGKRECLRVGAVRVGPKPTLAWDTTKGSASEDLDK